MLPVNQRVSLLLVCKIAKSQATGMRIQAGVEENKEKKKNTVR